ncbi:MAG: Ppx/GppA family phosphatase [Ignavibacteria bacterium]|nr:Ppx/GppA family phosphatase [Ignavibacteria bacterium]MBT8380910.1 Ppx/GppA family phosphatase [Ignavibacteria bacterium]MBT8391011.1 Ppx/GppA family phosphatase [Ignavibacteria bacterium]NNJ54159.1 Ppx/GppA family phosphatase [Ignavibacteriaceae bacterium]NNL20666.1 Ppx/GppA family phosphatase [Ignavibacteriaceae bacterium]
MKKCIAAIDMGTNSFHLIIVEIKKDGTFKIVDREREVIRLGSHRDGFKIISEGEIEKAIDILRDFGKIALFYKAEIRAIATSAVREAKNKNEFIERVYEETGISVEAINGKAEAELIYLGVQNALEVEHNRILCIDIGGGSTEFLLGQHGASEFAESIKIGAVRLSKMFFPDYILTDPGIDLCRQYIQDKINTNSNLHSAHKFDFAVGTSGTIVAAASIISFRRLSEFRKSMNGFVFSANEIFELTEDILKCKSPVDRLFIEGMEIKRADIIPAGLLILSQVFETFKLTEMKVSENALREGIIVNTISKMEEAQSLAIYSFHK